ncbi:hypothetical protein [Hymenobacter mucosus]|uniref:Por secretion system C-terminal sorting domain-containing protein n=1 Tax=Hymenobacter mucosus TaxID=1411120 RepID=A0A238X6D3_9BACT|nr:hypothetical protein [Hymenobacter mucosus]SNR53904.1 hypothetical protein SAMN06269173_103487 [Hymenobacter mucosus]
MKFALPSRIAGAVALLFTYCSHLAVAQTQNTDVIYSGTVSSHTSLNCGVLNDCVGIEFPDRFGTKDNLEDYAILHPRTLSVLNSSPVGVTTEMANAVPSGSRAGIVLSRHGDLLTTAGANVLNNLSIITWGAEGSQTYNGGSLLNAELVAQAPTRLEFIAKKPFTSLRVEYAAVTSVATKFRLYYAYSFKSNNTNTQYLGATSITTNNVTSGTIPGGVVQGCVNSGVTNPAGAADNDVNTFATFGSLAQVNCPSFLNVKLTRSVGPTDYRAGFVVGSAGLVDLNVLNGFSVVTYLGDKQQEVATGINALQVNVLPDDKSQISFSTTKPFDRVELRQNSLVSATYNLNVFYGFGIESKAFRDPEPVRSTLPVATTNVKTFRGSVACADISIGSSTSGCSGITNPLSSVDPDTTNFTTITQPLVAGGERVRVRMKLEGNGFAGNRAGVVLGASTGLLNLKLLENTTLRTYAADGVTLRETFSDGSLLNASVLSGNKTALSFLTTRDFGWVELDLPAAAAISLATETQVYYAFAEEQRLGFPTNLIGPSGPLPVQLVSFQAKAAGGGVDIKWQTASEANSSHFVVERSATSAEGFAPIGRVAAAGTTTSRQEYLLRDAEAGEQEAAILYYRLRQVDMDGKEHYSQVVPVKWSTPALALIVYPNPAVGAENIRVQLAGTATEGNSLAVYGARAELISRLAVSGREVVLPSALLRTGIYQLVLLNNAGQRVATQRLVVAGR